MTGLTWEQMFSAIKALDDDACLRMRKPGDWYVDTSVEIGGDGMLHSAFGNGSSPEQAVREHWKIYTTIEPRKYAVMNALSGRRRHVRWNGFLWEDVPLPPHVLENIKERKE